MSVEAELKLALPHEHLALARETLDALAGTAGRPMRLANLYYDTPELDLQRSRSALRLRLSGTRWLQTFKSGGGASAGLHRRHEWEMQVTGEALEADALLAAIERDLGSKPDSKPAVTSDSTSGSSGDSTSGTPGSEEHTALQSALQTLRTVFPRIAPLFRTDFTRTLWNLEEGDNRIEAALDEGEVSLGEGAQRQTTPIVEIELELKRGDEAALHRVAKILSERIPGLKGDDVSKAERGYRLHARLRDAAR
jgi:triphosphatase